MSVNTRTPGKGLLAKGVIAALVIAPVGVATAGAASAATTTATPDVTVYWKVTQDWTSGYQVEADVVNTGTKTLNPWRVDVVTSQQLGSAWDVDAKPTTQGFTMGAPGWNSDKSLKPGAEAKFGAVMNQRVAGARVPTSCVVAGYTCKVVEGTPVTPTPQPVDPQPVDPQPVDPKPVDPQPVDPQPTNPTGDSSLALNVSTTGSWQGGGNLKIVVKNTGKSTITSWKADLPTDYKVDSLWGAKNNSTAGHIAFENEEWSGTIKPGETKEVGLGVSGGNGVLPTTGTATTSNGVATVVVTATGEGPAGTGAGSKPVAVPAATNVGDFKVAPYVDLTMSAGTDMVASMKATGVKNYSGAFITSSTTGGDTCRPAFGGNVDLEGASDNWTLNQINTNMKNLRANGGDFLISFGGEGGSELALKCKDVDSLTKAYAKVIDTYHLTRVDFDIEGGPAQSDQTSLVNRAKAIANLQKMYPNLKVGLTLPVLESGLVSEGRNVVTTTVQNGARVDTINLMTMAYGHDVPDMGQAAIDAVNNTAQQLKDSGLFPGKTKAQLVSMIGATPWLGENGNPGQNFTVDNAKKLAAFAKANNLGELSYWRVNDDAAKSFQWGKAFTA